jgi:hypothetical protein
MASQPHTPPLMLPPGQMRRRAISESNLLARGGHIGGFADGQTSRNIDRPNHPRKRKERSDLEGRMNNYEVAEPILNSPYNEPTAYWHIEEGQDARAEGGGTACRLLYRDPKAPAGNKRA